MAFGEFLANSRLKNVFSQPVDRNTMTGFNPAKRLYSGILPRQEPQFKPSLPQPPKIDFSQPQGGSGLGDDYMDRYFNLLQEADKNHPAMTAYEAAINQRPRMADSKPSLLRRIGASIAGAGAGASGGAGAGIQTAEHILRSPYESRIEEYEREVEGRRGAAELEHARASDYKANIGAAANYGIARGDKESANFWKQREWENKDYSERTERQKELREYENTQSQITDRINQSKNRDEITRLTRIRDENTRVHNAAMAGAANRRAGAAETAAGAAVTSAGNKGPYITPDQQTDTRNLAMQKLYDSGMFEGMIKVNQGEYGPTYEVDPRADHDWVNAKIEEAEQEIVDKMYNKGKGKVKKDAKGRVLINESPGLEDDRYEVGDIQR